MTETDRDAALERTVVNILAGATPDELTAALEAASVEDVREHAKLLDIAGRSKMDVTQLVEAIVAKTFAPDPATQAPAEPEASPVDDAPKPLAPDDPQRAAEEGRPPLVDVAEAHCANLLANARVIGEPLDLTPESQEDK